MKITELKLEYPGIFGTITQYTRNPYIVGYLEVMKEYIDNEDIDNLVMCLEKLVRWYEINYDFILKNEYVMNKEDHKQTKAILEAAIRDLS